MLSQDVPISELLYLQKRGAYLIEIIKRLMPQKELVVGTKLRE